MKLAFCPCLTWEATPGKATGLLDEMPSGYAVRSDWQTHVDWIFATKPTGLDVIASTASQIGPMESNLLVGAYINSSNELENNPVRELMFHPAVQAERQLGKSALHRYATLRALYGLQESVGGLFHLAGSTLERANVIEVDLGRSLSIDDMKHVLTVIQRTARSRQVSPRDYAVLSTRSGFRVLALNLASTRRIIVFDALSRVGDDLWKNPVFRQGRSLYITNDWSKYPNGEQFLARLHVYGLSVDDVQRLDDQLLSPIRGLFRRMFRTSKRFRFDGFATAYATMAARFPGLMRKARVTVERE